MHAEILSIGDEITSGRLLDTNSQWLSQRLEDLGIRVLHHAAVGDELEPLAAVFRQALERSDVIVATGGLGPTADDLTREALAQAAGVALEQRPEALEHVRSIFARMNRPMPPQNDVQALFPIGSQIIPNPNGTAPGIELEYARPGRGPSRIFCLPGVPAEMVEMWHGTVERRLRQAGAGQRIIRHRQLRCFGAGESAVEAMLPDLIRRGRVPRVGINASKATIILRITAEGATAEEADAAMGPTVATIRQCLGNLVFGEGDEELQHALVRLLTERSRTLATLEWGTAGLLADWFGEVPGAEAGYRGGLVVRSAAALKAALGVSADPGLADRPRMEAAAQACRERFATDYALAVGPFPAEAATAQAPKTVVLALASADGVHVREVPFASHPALLKILCAKQALNLARLSLLGAVA